MRPGRSLGCVLPSQQWARLLPARQAARVLDKCVTFLFDQAIASIGQPTFMCLIILLFSPGAGAAAGRPPGLSAHIRLGALTPKLFV